MTRSFVLTVLGDDRPGLVEQLAEQVAVHDGNWLESRMARLAGKFAGILRIEVPAERAASLTGALASLEASGLRIVVEAGDAADRPSRAARLELVGSDHPGIVRDVSRALAGRGVNVEELRSELAAAPMSGEALFRATARLHLPPALDLEALRADLEQVSHDLMVELFVDEPEGG